MRPFFYFPVALALLLLLSGSYAWHNDTVDNDTCLVIESDSRKYWPNGEGEIFVEYRITNNCEKALKVNFGEFVETKHESKVSTTELLVADSLKSVGLVQKPDYKQIELVKEKTGTKDFTEKPDFKLKEGYKAVDIKKGVTWLKATMVVPFEDGEFVLTAVDDTNSEIYSILDPSFSGTGSSNDPYIMTTCSDLNQISAYLESSTVFFELGNDIDCGGAYHYPIGESDSNMFKGHFDGNNYTISNMNIKRNGYAGFFGFLGFGASIQRTNFVDVNVIVGALNDGAVVAGKCSGCDINTTSVYGGSVWSDTASYYVAGFVAELTSSSDESYDGNITNCYQDGVDVNAGQAEGSAGFVGSAAASAGAAIEISNSYSTGFYSDKGGVNNTGPFIGYAESGTEIYNNLFFDNETCGNDTSDVQATGKSTANMHKQATFTNWDFVNIWDIDEDLNYPTFQGVAAAGGSPDTNIWQLDGYDINAGLPFFGKDSNITITFTVFDSDSFVLDVDLNYSTQNTQGTGTVIIDDLRLDSDSCADTDWTDELSVCEWDWNPSGVDDSNYFILIEATDLTNTNFDVSTYAAGIREDINITIYKPKNEKTNATIDLPVYSYEVSILDGNTTNEYTNLTADENYYSASKGTDYYIVFTIDTNVSADYYQRTYYKKYEATDYVSTIQPYLVPVADSAEITFYTKNATDLSTEPNILIKAYKVIEGVGRVEVETMRTDESGTGTMTMIVDDEYELVVSDASDNELFTKAIRANFTAYYIYIDSGEITWSEPTIEWIEVTGFPETGYIEFDSSGYDFNLVLDVNGGTISKRWMSIDTNADSNIMFNSTCTRDCNYHIPFELLDSVLEVRVTVFVETQAGKTFYMRKAFIPLDKSGYNLIATLRSGEFRREWGCSTSSNDPCFFLLMVSAMLTIGVLAAAGTGITTDTSALSILAMVSLGLFTYLTWVPFPFFLLGCLAAFSTIVIARSVF